MALVKSSQLNYTNEQKFETKAETKVETKIDQRIELKIERKIKMENILKIEINVEMK